MANGKNKSCRVWQKKDSKPLTIFSMVFHSLPGLARMCNSTKIFHSLPGLARISTAIET
jgi:hypothetical protein